jgi:hypothetical protein
LTGADALLQTVLQVRGEIEGIGAERQEEAGALAFSAVPLLSGRVESLAAVAASVHTILAQLAPRATLETVLGGRSAHSIIDYRGQVTTVFGRSACGAPEAALAAAHLERLGSTFALRAAFAGAIAAAGGTLVAISLAVMNPLGVFHALSMARALEKALQRLTAAVEEAA